MRYLICLLLVLCASCSSTPEPEPTHSRLEVDSAPTQSDLTSQEREITNLLVHQSHLIETQLRIGRREIDWQLYFTLVHISQELMQLAEEVGRWDYVNIHARLPYIIRETRYLIDQLNTNIADYSLRSSFLNKLQTVLDAEDQIMTFLDRVQDYQERD